MAFQYTGIQFFTNSNFEISIIADGTSSGGKFTIPPTLLTPLLIPGVGFPTVTSHSATIPGATVTSLTVDFPSGLVSFTLSAVPAAGATANWDISFAWMGS